MTDDEIARIDLAVFSADLWREERGAPFMKVLLEAPNATWLHMFSAGLDNPVFPELGRRGITVTHSAGSSAIPIAHTVIMHVISLCRETRAFGVAQSEHRWANSGTLDLEGRRMGIVGLGAIGTEVARLAAHFGIDVIGMRRTPTGDEPCTTWPITRLHELLAQVDDLVLTAPLTDETRGLIGADELALLPSGAHVVNVGRGELVDEDALVAALQSGHLGGAALDVFVVEPLPADEPAVGPSQRHRHAPQRRHHRAVGTASGRHLRRQPAALHLRPSAAQRRRRGGTRPSEHLTNSLLLDDVAVMNEGCLSPTPGTWPHPRATRSN